MKLGTPYFIRLDGCSPKDSSHKSRHGPQWNAETIIYSILGSRRCYQHDILKNLESHLILIPWNFRIDPSNEIRCFVYNGKVFCIFSERREAEGRAREQRRAESPELRPGCKALGYWDGKSEEKILRTTTTTTNDDGRSKMTRSHMGIPPNFSFFVFKILSNFLH